MEEKNGIQVLYAADRKAWRQWLEENHQSAKAVWLIFYRKSSKVPSVYYPEAVDEALCFGWIDSTANKRDEQSYCCFFTKRNPKSNWSKVNKEKVARLTEQDLMTPAGIAMVELAKKNGTWEALDAVENLVVPEDLQQGFAQNPLAFENWEKFSRTAKKGFLEWIFTAKQPQTRQKRVEETIKRAEENRTDRAK